MPSDNSSFGPIPTCLLGYHTHFVTLWEVLAIHVKALFPLAFPCTTFPNLTS